ncbi:hypothetical protein EM595_p0237 (plasmid) [Duffyella gerundensis]|uniref:Uncharacterized protein n=1 Tax=Duffyella gerundensis TaxID=1619313 RepID=A0A0U5L7P6_9GAMM|nr:hypothetical protein EM595_p0237 [Duffyella gerundensis]
MKFKGPLYLNDIATSSLCNRGSKSMSIKFC